MAEQESWKEEGEKEGKERGKGKGKGRRGEKQIGRVRERRRRQTDIQGKRETKGRKTKKTKVSGH